MMKKSVFVLLMVCVLSFSLPAQGEITITPANVQLPTAAGEDLSFDFVITNLGDPCGVSAISFQSTITTSGPGTLTFDGTSSTAVTGEASYWLPSSPFVGAFENPPGNYVFSDEPLDGLGRVLAADDIIARYVFEWDGTVGDFTFTLDPDIADSFFLKDDFTFITFVPLAIDPGEWLPGDSGSFTVYIPEPATLMLLGLGGFLLRKRRA